MIQKKPSHVLLLFILLLVATITGVSSDIYTPSFLNMSHDLKTSISHIQHSMVIFMFGVALSQWVYGPISDAIGRRKPLITGLIIMMLGGFVCFFSKEMVFLLIGRFLQGIGCGACACLWRSIFKDCFDGAQMIKYGAYLGIVMTFVVPAAPAIGGYLQHFFGWRANFSFLIIYSLLILFFVFFFLKETSMHHHKDRLSKKFFMQACSQLLYSPVFMGYTCCTFLTYGSFFSWFVIGPVLIVDQLGIDPVEFGWINFFTGALSMSLGGVFNGKMVKRIGAHRILRLGWRIIFSSALLMLLLKQLMGLTLFSLICPIFLAFFGATLIWPSAFAGAFAPFGKIAGYAGAFYTFMQLSGGAVIGGLGSFLPKTSQYPLVVIFLFSPLLSLLIFEKIVVKNSPLTTELDKPPL